MVLVADDEELDVNEGLCPAFGLTCGCILSMYIHISIFTWEGCSQNAYLMELLSDCLKLHAMYLCTTIR